LTVCACPILHAKCVVLGHNTIRGAAGGSLLNAELCKKGIEYRKCVIGWKVIELFFN